MKKSQLISTMMLLPVFVFLSVSVSTSSALASFENVSLLIETNNVDGFNRLKTNGDAAQVSPKTCIYALDKMTDEKGDYIGVSVALLSDSNAGLHFEFKLDQGELPLKESNIEISLSPNYQKAYTYADGILDYLVINETDNGIDQINILIAVDPDLKSPTEAYVTKQSSGWMKNGMWGMNTVQELNCNFAKIYTF